jgi:glycosyltransferase involved in cell wall biosynthesis
MSERQNERGGDREIIILPAHNLWEAWSGQPADDAPDREKTFRILSGQGYRYRRLDPLHWPWNPFARSNPVLLAIDPLRALYVLVKYRKAAVVLCCFESAALVLLLLRRLFFFKPKIAVLDLGVPGEWPLRDIILRRVVPRADLLLPLGSNQASGLALLGADPVKIRPFRNGTSPDFFTQTVDCPDGYVLAIGDDISRDYPTFLNAVRGLPRDVVIRSRRVAEDRAAFPKVSIVSASLAPKNYRRLIAEAAIVVLPLRPSRHAGGVSSLLEAMSCGKAVIVSASPGLSDYVVDGLNCRVVPPRDAPALRTAIEQLLSETDTRTALGASARNFILENCSDQSSARQLASAFAAVAP